MVAPLVDYQESQILMKSISAVETTTLSSGAQNQLDGFNARDCSWHESEYKKHITSGRDYMVVNFRKLAAAYEFVCDVKFPDEWYEKGERPTSELTDEKYKGATECGEPKGTTCPYIPGPSKEQISKAIYIRDKTCLDFEGEYTSMAGGPIRENFQDRAASFGFICNITMPKEWFGNRKPNIVPDNPELVHPSECKEKRRECGVSTTTLPTTTSDWFKPDPNVDYVKIVKEWDSAVVDEQYQMAWMDATTTTTTTTPTTTSTTTTTTTTTTTEYIPVTEFAHQCLSCNNFSFCEVLAAKPLVCEKCACPLGREGECCDDVVDVCGGPLDPCRDDTEDMHRRCERQIPSGRPVCVCQPGWTGVNCTEIHDPCKNSECKNNATCEADGDGYVCVCPKQFSGRFCEMLEWCYPDCFPCEVSGSRCKNDGVCWPNLQPQKLEDFQCICVDGYTGPDCREELPCEVTNPCNNGGICYVEYGREVCDCPAIWTGPYCDDFNICHDGDEKCIYGTCNRLAERVHNCTCFPGYTGADCSININECDDNGENVCAYDMPCIDGINDFTCICAEGLSGKKCEINFDDCVLEEKNVTNRCTARDRLATCEDLINNYTCHCSENWMGQHCTMRVVIWNVLKHFKNADESLVDMLEDLLAKPELIKETLPFFLALMPPDNQTDISWDHEDLFSWVTFEGQELDLKKDMVKWNAATLGNCFTFNHDSQPEKMPLRYAGEQEGFRALMRVRQDEYLDWIDTASLLVFVHSSTESVFGESLRFQARPGSETSLMISQTSFERLGGAFGKCVKDKSEAKSYYYEGHYATDGCLRSCFQDAVFEACKCMDPRFPQKEGAALCDLSNRKCVEEVTAKKGDPSQWPDCHCPLPCSNGQYNIKWSQMDLSSRKEDCSKLKADNASFQACLARSDTALISVYLPHLIQNTFKEEPKIDFNKFIANLGGFLGILCGICIITFVEFLFLLFQIIAALLIRPKLQK
ncbi:hypothetical protein QR680_008668 [Steinernema hermaphroditum]|uniref:EGF-like domain-containing protein n=1 Tax=Steinernema hermaphroditum TaxID=289476 RepID=A0AA39IHF9_9BILA|nr:hypothetical protein QR680_008668 [Steinernema hermaphroditum]